MSRFETLLSEVHHIKKEREDYSETLRKQRLLETYGEKYYKSLKKQAEYELSKQGESSFVYQKEDKRKLNGHHPNNKNRSIYYPHKELIQNLLNQGLGTGKIANYLKNNGLVKNATKQGIYYFIKIYGLIQHVSD